MTTSTMSGLATDYSSALTSSSATYARAGGSSFSYYEAYELNITVTGFYTVTSISSMDTYGYLYINQFDRSSPSLNQLSSDDDNGGGAQFRITYTLQAGLKYIVVVTTYGASTTGSYTMRVSGPSRASVRPTNAMSSSTTSSPPSSSPGNFVFCNGMNYQGTCPGKMISA